MPGHDRYRVSIYPDGTLYYNFPTVLQSECKMDQLQYPFDVQTCDLKFGSWSHSGAELDLKPDDKSGMISYTVPSIAIHSRIIFVCCDRSFA